MPAPTSGQAHWGQEELGDGLDDEDHRQEPPGGQLCAARPDLEAVAQEEAPILMMSTETTAMVEETRPPSGKEPRMNAPG